MESSCLGGFFLLCLESFPLFTSEGLKIEMLFPVTSYGTIFMAGYQRISGRQITCSTRWSFKYRDVVLFTSTIV